MNIFILNRSEEVVQVLSDSAEKSACHFFNSKLIVELNKGTNFTFEVDASQEEVLEHLKEENYVVVPYGSEYKLLIIREISDVHEESLIKEVYCEDASVELADEVILENFTGKLEIIDVLKKMLLGTRWTSGTVDDAYIRSIKEDYKTRSVLDGIYTLAKEYDVEVEFSVEFVGNKITERKVNIKKAFGRTLGKRLESSKDISSLKRTIQTGDIKTAIIPFGKTDEETGETLTIKNVKWSKPTNPMDKPLNQTFLEDKEATELWGYAGADGNKRPRWFIVTFDDVEDENELINLAHLQLKRMITPKITYEVEALDLFRILGEEEASHEEVKLGDLVNIIDHEFTPALALASRVVKIEHDLNNPANTKFTLGNVVESIVDKDLKTQLQELNYKVGAIQQSKVDLSDIEDRLDNIETNIFSGRFEHINELNNLLFGQSLGYHYVEGENGLWIYDKPKDQTPSKVVAIKGGMIGLGEWDTQLNQWKIGTFIDGTSVNASMITTGTLHADRIEGGTLDINKFTLSLQSKIKDIDDKASFTYVDTSIKTAVDSIELSVSSKYSTKEATQSAVENAIEGVVIGGSNLQRNADFSKPLAGTWSYSTNHMNIDTGVLCGKYNSVKIHRTGQTAISNMYLYSGANNIPAKYDDEFTMSFEYFIPTDVEQEIDGNFIAGVWFYKNGSNSAGSVRKTLESEIVKGQWTKVSITGKASDIETSSVAFVVGFTKNCEIYISKPKLEKGNKATDFSICQEDVQEQLDNKADSNDVYTKAETESAISISADKINQSVSSKYLSKSDATSTYATKSSLTQTADSITATFESSGGYNLLKNGCFSNSTNHWSKWGSPTNTVETSTTGYVNQVKIVTTGTNQGLQQTVSNLKSGKTYILSAYVYASSGVCAIQVANNGSYTGSYSTTTGAWQWLTHKFTASSTSASIQIGRNGNGSNGTYYYTALMLQEGSVKSAYSPHPNEIYSGSTVIDSSGVTVKNGALKVQNNSGTTVLSGNSNGDLTLTGTVNVRSNNNEMLSVSTSNAKVPMLMSNSKGTYVPYLTIAGDYTAYSEDKAYSGIDFDGTGSIYVNNSTTSPTAINVIGGIQCSNWLRSTGSTGWINSTYGGGWYMKDTTWLRTYGSKRVYVDSILRADGGLQVGESGAYLNVTSAGTVTASSNVVSNGHLYAKAGILYLGQNSNASYVAFYDSSGTRSGYIGKGNTSAKDIYISAEASKYILATGHLTPSADKTYWVGTTTPTRLWKGLCAEGGTVGSSDIISKENIERLDGTIVGYDEVLNEIREYSLSNLKANPRAIGNDYYTFIKDRFKPSYYNYKLSEQINQDSGEYTISPEAEYNMLKNIGFIAQDYDIETDKVAKEFIFKNEDGTLSYNHMSYVTVGMIALQEATRKIDALEKENKVLKEELDKIKKHLGI